MRTAPLVLLAALAAACGQAGSDAPAPRNVLLVSLDTVRADRLGCYGYTRDTSPNLDALAARGTLFHNAVAQSPWTLPSHATMLTGLFPHRHGVVQGSHRLADDVPTLPAQLAKAGLATGAVVNSQFLGPRYGLDRGFDASQLVSEKKKGGPEITDRALAWLDEQDGPFFLLVHYYDAHSPYTPDAAFTPGLVSDYSGPADGTTGQLQRWRKGEVELTDEDLAHVSDLYDAEIRELDDQVQRLLDGLEARGLLRDTLVLVTSDHGEEFGEHGGVLHGRTLHGELLDVPLIVAGPGVAAGHRETALAMQSDIVPTVLAALGIALQAPVDGIDLFAPPESARHRMAFAEADHNNDKPDTLRMVRNLRFKLLYDRLSKEVELYDLEADPTEQQDVAAGHADLVEQLRLQIQRLRGTAAPTEEIEPLSAEDIELLEELGYL